jgi:hypothetical protein
MIIAQIDPQSLVIIAGVLIVCTLLLISTRRRMRERTPNLRDYVRQQAAGLRDQQVIKGDMEELLAQLQDLARQINSQIDTRFAKLEACIGDADQRIERLERLLRRASKIEGLDVTVTDETEPGPARGQPEPIKIDPVHQQIYALADAGKPAVQIARELGRTTGEIELILNLRRRANTGARGEP